MENGEPKEVYRFERYHLFGVFKIIYYIEDRRPDLTEEEYPGKYKNFIQIRFLWKTYCWVYRTNHYYTDSPYIKG